MFRATIIALVATMASAKSFLPSNDIAANSELGNRLLKSATVVKEARHLEQGDRDVTFIANYNLKYLGCSSLASMSGEGGGGDEGVLYTQHLVRFALCPDSCSSCANGGEYVVNMMEFVDTYTESILEAQEYACEMVRENCYCDNANDDDVCEAQCYATAGLDYCIEYEGQEAFEIQEYLECAGKYQYMVSIGSFYLLSMDLSANPRPSFSSYRVGTRREQRIQWLQWIQRKQQQQQ